MKTLSDYPNYNFMTAFMQVVTTSGWNVQQLWI